MMENIADTIDSALINLGLKKSIEKQRALIYWKKVAGDKIDSNTQAMKIKKGVLYVNASSSVWAQELALMKNQLIKKLNSCLGEDVISDIRFAGRGIKDNEIAKKDDLDNIKKLTLNETEMKLISNTANDLKYEEIKTKMIETMVADKKYKKYKEIETKKQR